MLEFETIYDQNVKDGTRGSGGFFLWEFRIQIVNVKKEVNRSKKSTSLFTPKFWRQNKLQFLLQKSWRQSPIRVFKTE